MTADAALRFPAAHPALAGHFPGLPIVPGVLLLDAAIHALEAQGQAVHGVAAAKFLQIVGPDEPLALVWTAGDASRASFEIRSGALRAATGTLRLSPALPP